MTAAARTPPHCPRPRPHPHPRHALPGFAEPRCAPIAPGHEGVPVLGLCPAVLAAQDPSSEKPTTLRFPGLGAC